ncbi:glycosyltransferase family 2 protein [Fibrivirga algicola]|uniref:Glycosyltransferase family 2 protein n=1 Tax=Fibrivirga algicola TaxID=2950420 RepID=A0ABX0QLK1_9BACT|nr:glycosyltransferase family 2 protein [Fibrivirga algicola]NID11902.1 glycosyltransferase family 2 protein [Fibrivirga algicola]
MIPGQARVDKATVAGVVVLYHSPPSCIEHIQTYLPQIDKLYIVDNTPEGVGWADAFAARTSNVVYVGLGANKGIAHALNAGATKAIADGYTYLLTMDDDSRAPENMIETMARFWNMHLNDPIGIVCPQHALTTATSTAKPTETAPRTVLTTMTSGNLISLPVYQQVGGFDDELFIDVVDHDYTLKLAVHGYTVIELSTLQLVHRLGQQRAVLGGLLRYVTHRPVRNYYLIRNSILVGLRHRKQHPAYLIEALRTVLIEVVKISLFENQKRVRLRYAWQALRDGLR